MTDEIKKEKNTLQLMLASSENLSFSGVRVLTGTPGAGKTLRMAYFMEQAHKQGMNCFISNNDTFKFEFLQYLDDPRQWATLPKNSVLFIDEAQKFFRQRRGNVEVPAYLTDMETLRHRGIAIVMTTQKPTYLDTHIRGLTGLHEHMIPGMGSADNATVHQWRELQEDVKSQSLLDAASKFTWWYPKHLYAMYESAEVHTKSKSIPPKQKLLYALGLVMLIIVGSLAYRMISRGSIAPVTDAKAQATAEPLQESGNRRKPTNVADYLRMQTPVIPAQPWTAPQFDNLKTSVKPMVYCMASDVGGDNPSCSCITEQGTVYMMPPQQCNTIARNGLYNPYKQQGNAQQQQRQAYAPTMAKPEEYESFSQPGEGSPSEVGSPLQGSVW